MWHVTVTVEPPEGTAWARMEGYRITTHPARAVDQLLGKVAQLVTLLARRLPPAVGIRIRTTVTIVQLNSPTDSWQLLGTVESPPPATPGRRNDAPCCGDC